MTSLPPGRSRWSGDRISASPAKSRRLSRSTYSMARLTGHFEVMAVFFVPSDKAAYRTNPSPPTAVWASSASSHSTQKAHCRQLGRGASLSPATLGRLPRSWTEYVDERVLHPPTTVLSISPVSLREPGWSPSHQPERTHGVGVVDVVEPDFRALSFRHRGRRGPAH
jgi:hypothetical protein